MSQKEKYIWLTDTHLDKVFPWNKFKLINKLKEHNPKGIFLTGDISNGLMLGLDLKILANWIDCPIYFILGNHDKHFSSIEKTRTKIRKLCKEYANLIWLTEADIIPLSDEVALIGTEGWYDAAIGNPEFLKYTPDWLLIEDFRKLPSMQMRIELFQKLADRSCDLIIDKLEKALEQDFKTIFVLTHFPPWQEATRDVGTLMEPFWLPYNVNLRLGQVIENVMKDRPKRQVEVICGHTHTPEYIRVSRNIKCQVGSPHLKSHVIYV